jgi:Rod binding domain-containing protein
MVDLKINPLSKPLSHAEQIKPYKEIAEGMEEQFTNYLIDQMKKGIPKDEASSSAQNYYESLRDQEYAAKMAQSDTGIGLKRTILEQILPAHLKKTTGVNQQGQIAYNKSQGVQDATSPLKGVEK